MSDESLKGTIDGKAQVLARSIGEIGLKGQIEIDKKEILSKYPNADRSLIDNRYYYTICSIVMRSRKSDDEKIKEIRQLRKDILGGSPNADLSRDRFAIRQFIQRAGTFNSQVRGVGIGSCKYADVETKVTKFSLSEKHIVITQERSISRQQCRDFSDGELCFSVESFDADLADLSNPDGGDFRSAVSDIQGYFLVRCTVGSCVNFSIKREGCIYGTDSEAGRAPAMRIWLDRNQASQFSSDFSEFKRALARVIDVAQ